MPNKRQAHPKPNGEIERILNPEKKGSMNRRIIASGFVIANPEPDKHDYFLHATKGWRRYSK